MPTRSSFCMLLAVLLFLAKPVLGGPVAAGTYHSAYVDANGVVWTWGDNAYGQLGDGTTTARLHPVAVSGLSSATAIAAGAYHTLVVRADGTVATWGLNSSNQLGLGPNPDPPFNVPRTVAGLSNVVAIAGGTYHSLALTSDGTVWSWGNNSQGQLGDGTTTDRATPTALGLTNIVAIAAGQWHSQAVASDGTRYAWGRNSTGALGDGTTIDRLSPVTISGVTSVTTAAAGWAHSLVRRATGGVQSWGANGQGQLGVAGGGSSSPITVTALSTIAQVVAGGDFGLALDTAGAVWSWGRNANGQLGDGTTVNHTTPAALTAPTGVQAIAAGPYHVVALTSSAEVWTWGDNAHGQLGDGTTVDRAEPSAINSGGAWRTARPVFTPGSGTYSTPQTPTLTSLTSGATIHYTTDGSTPTTGSPSIASGQSLDVSTSQTITAIAIATGMPASALTTAAYTLSVAQPDITPGTGSYTAAQTVTLSSSSPGVTLRYTLDGTDPTGASSAYSTPLSVATTTTIKAKGFRSGWQDSATRTATLTLNFGTLSTPTLSPTSGTYDSDQLVTMTADAGATIRYTTDGSTPSASSPVYSAPVPVAAATTVKARAFRTDWTASGTRTETYAFKVATPTFSFDSGTYAPGQTITIASLTPNATIRYTLDGSTPTTSDPVLASGAVITLGAFTVRTMAWRTGYTTSDLASATYALNAALTSARVAGGGSHSLALRDDGTVWGWGLNSGGQVGDGTTTQRTTPVSVSNLANVVAIAAGEAFSVAALADGTVWAWGLNTNGQLGDGTTTQRTTPVRSGTLTGIAQVAAGRSHALARTGSGAVWAWGLNSQGQLGDNSTTQRTSPVAVSGVTAASIAAGWQHSLATQASGAVAAWGYNATGQLGDGTTTRRLTPITVPNLPSVDTVAGGETHSLALTPDDAVLTWGGNASGQLGDGTTTQQTGGIPVSGTQLTWGVVAPTATPTAGIFTATTTVTLATVTPGATIHYTTDGTEPTEADATFVTGTPIAVDGTMTIKAKAWKTGLTASPTSTLVYTLRPVTPTLTPAPTGSPFTSAQTVTLATTTSGAEIRYTLDGTTPTSSSALYSSAVTIATGTTV
ncbi:MAG: chitobiase/beta-hexosaminidase C-terminal domain-containing protein, partial [Vicinamibacterales bacterium]